MIKRTPIVGAVRPVNGDQENNCVRNRQAGRGRGSPTESHEGRGVQPNVKYLGDLAPKPKPERGQTR